MSDGESGLRRNRSEPAREAAPRRAPPPRIVAEGAWIAFSQVMVALGGLAGTRVLTSLLDPAVYGQVSLVTGVGALGAGLLCTPFLQAALRSFPDARSAGKVGVLRGMAGHYLRRGVAAIVLLLVVVGGSWGVWGPTPIAFAVFAAAAAVVAADAWRTFECGFLNGARRQRDFAVRTSFDAVAKPVAAVALVLWLGPSAFHVVLGFAGGSVLVGAILRHRVVAGNGAGEWQADPWASAHGAAFLRYAVPLIPLAALNWIMSMGDRYVLAATWGAEAVGVYWAAYALGSQSFIAANALIYTTLRPVLYDAVARGDSGKERRTLRVWLLVVVAVAGAGWLLTTVLAKPLCAVLLGPAYGAAAPLLPYIAAAYALQMIQQTFEMILYAHGGSKRLVVLQSIAAASAVVLYLLLIPRYGARGAALGTLGSFVVTTTVAFVLSGASRRIFGRAPSAA